MGFGDLDVVDLTDAGVEAVGDVVDEDVAVDLMGLALEPALKEQVRFLLEAFEKHLIGVADLCAV